MTPRLPLLELDVMEALLELQVRQIDTDISYATLDAERNLVDARVAAAQNIRDAELALMEARRELAAYRAALAGPRGWLGWEVGVRRQKGLQ